MGSARYTLLAEGGDGTAKDKQRPVALYLTTALILLTLSLALNAYCFYLWFASPWKIEANLPSRYCKSIGVHTCHTTLKDMLAGVRRNLPTTFIAHSSASSTNSIREYVNENYDDVPRSRQTWKYSHIVHCLSMVREGIMCAADDTPFYMGKFNANANVTHPIVGDGFATTCRSWDAMMNWARANSACFINRFRPEVKNMTNERERYTDCPDGAQPWLGVADYESRVT
ncbi:hypothetical protein ANO11243_018110 [Dothideomycetidae sp. 11243]|nr:hypothetical protein ANO11243_018110 [fungal sp. No.11243]